MFALRMASPCPERRADLHHVGALQLTLMLCLYRPACLLPLLLPPPPGGSAGRRDNGCGVGHTVAAHCVLALFGHRVGTVWASWNAEAAKDPDNGMNRLGTSPDVTELSGIHSAGAGISAGP